jgi:hypothetical protein
MLRPAIIQAGKRMVPLTAKHEKLEKNCLYFSASKNNSTKVFIGNALHLEVF